MIKDIKVILVNPAQKFLQDPLKTEPLGLMYIESVLEKLNIDVEIIDMSFQETFPFADIYGFYASTINFSQVIEYAKQVKPAYTILGGPHASALPEDAKEFFDAVVVGQGEGVIEQILRDFSNGRKGGIYKNSLVDINSIPIPSRKILRKINYNSFGNGTRSASIITSRGCPYQCSFCASNTIWGRKVQYRKVNNVIEEIHYLKNEFGIQNFKFVDDTFTLNKIRFKKFSDALSDIDISWTCNTRVNAITDEVLGQMVKGNCSTVELGIESVDNIALHSINKDQEIEDVKKVILKIKSRNLKVKLYIIYGLPFESKDIAQKTIDFIKETAPDFVSLFTLVPYPGTDIWMRPQDYNIKKIWKNFDRYQHAIGNLEEELSWLPNIEYFDRSREQLRDERNILKRFVISWNERQNV